MKKFIIVALVLCCSVLGDNLTRVAVSAGFKTGTGNRVNPVKATGEIKTEQTTTIIGKLLGSSGNPMPKADVHLLRFNQSKPLATVQAAKDGSFQLITNESGLFTLQFTGVNHKSHEIVLLIEKPSAIEITAKLKTYDYATDISKVKIIGDFNKFSFDSAKEMEKQPDGTFSAEFDGIGVDKFAYQLLGLTESGGSINGTQSESYVYDGGGDYRSVVTPDKGRVKVVFNPNFLGHSGKPPQVVFRDVNSTAARFSFIYEAMLKQSKSLHEALAAYKKTGKPLDEFSYNFSPDLAALSKQIAREKNPLLRQALLISYLDLGYGAYGAKLDSVVARKALAEIAPTSPLWSIEPRLLGVALDNSGQPEKYASYVRQLVENHSDSTVKRIAAAEYAPTRNIIVGKTVPPFSLISLSDPKTVYTSENLKGKTVLIDFWATWCVPCVEEMPNLHKAYEKYKGENFEILSVSLDERGETVQKFRAEKWKMPWLHSLISSNKETNRQFEIVGIPKTVLIDSSGKIVATQMELRGQNLDKTLMRVLSQAK
jgi:thiol-disulfide isomerase/thioredoxin